MSSFMWYQWLQRSLRVSRSDRPGRGPVRKLQCTPRLEALEDRRLLSGNPSVLSFLKTDHVVHTSAGLGPLDVGSPSPFGLTPAQIRHAYGIDLINFWGITGDGSGQTIAIVDAYNDPNFVSTGDPFFMNSDLHRFDLQFGLPDPPSFTKVAADGSNNYPSTDPGDSNRAPGDWETEEALDIEWAHSVAPGASILEVEADSSYPQDLEAAIDFARQQPGVSVVSMSFGGSNDMDQSVFVAPDGHQGETFVASTGDNGAPGQATSPSVVAIGGTTLSLNPDNTWQAEIGWSGSGGGVGIDPASEPSWQMGVQNTGFRSIPDVAFDADPDTGVAVLDSFNLGYSTPWGEVGGTSLSAPCWAGLMAITNQGRTIAGMGTLDGASQTLPALYALPSFDFHDITSGNNGIPAGPGYDFVTGLGSPIANLLVPDLAGIPGELSYVATQSVAPNNMVLSLNQAGDTLQLFNNGTLVASKALANTSAVHIIGANSTDDKLTILYSYGNFSPPVTFDSGGPFNSGTNDLVVDDSSNQYPELVTLTGQSVRATGLLASWTVNYRRSSLHSLAVTTGVAQDTVNVLSTSVKTHLGTGDGHDQVTIGNTGSVQGIKGDLTIENDQFTSTLFVDDSADTSARKVFVDSFTPSPEDSDFGSITGLAPAAIYYENVDMSAVLIKTGRKNDTVAVLDIDAPTVLDSGGGQDTVQVGSQGFTKFIRANLTIGNTSGATKLILDDSKDNTDQIVTLGQYKSFFGNIVGSITGLAPAEIDYAYARIFSLTIGLGNGKVEANILATGVTTTLNLGTSSARIDVGNAGNMQNITGILNVFRSPFLGASVSSLTLDDSADSNARTVTISHHAATKILLAYETVSGIAPADVTFIDGAIASLSIKTGTGNDAVRVLDTQIPTFLDSGGGQDTVRIGRRGSAQGILAALTIENTPSYSKIILDDSADTTDRQVTLKSSNFTRVGESLFGIIAGLAPALISYEYADVSSLALLTGNANLTIDVLATGVSTDLDTVESNATILVGDNGSLQNINGHLTVFDGLILGGARATTLTIDDSADSGPRTVTLSSFTELLPTKTLFEMITGLAPAAIDYQSGSLISATVNGGSSGNTFNVQSIVGGTSVALNSGTGNDTINLNNIDAIQAPLMLIAGAGTKDKLSLNDRPSLAPRTFGLSATGITRPGAPAISFDSTLENLVVNGGRGGNTFNAAPSPDTTYQLSGGSSIDTLNVDLTGVTAPDLIFNSPTSGEWVFGNRQPIVFTSIGNFTPAEALPYSEDFSDGIADHFIPWEGIWTPSGGHYGVKPALGGDAVSTLLLNTPLPGAVILGAALSMSPAAAGYDSNGFLIFDYHSPTDFKYAGARQSTGQWVIGQRTGKGWQDLAVFNEAITTDTFYSMNLLLNGNQATLEVGGAVKVIFAFADPVNTGSVGLGTENSISQFAVTHVETPG
jgi:hypothetical protein